MPKPDIAIAELQLFRATPSCATWFEYQEAIEQSMQSHIKDPSFDQFTEQVQTWISEYLLEPRSLHIQIVTFIELSEKLPKTFFQTLGFGLTPQQILAETFKKIHKKYSKERAGNDELDIQKDISAGENSLLSQAFPDIEEKIKLLQAQKSKLETQERNSYEAKIALLNKELSDAKETIESRDSQVRQLQNELGVLEKKIAEKDIQIQRLSNQCESFKIALARMQAENAMRFEKQQADITELKLALAKLTSGAPKEIIPPANPRPIDNKSINTPPTARGAADTEVRRYIGTYAVNASKEAINEPSTPTALPSPQ